VLHLACPAAFALISDYVSNADAGVRAGAIMGLGLAYAGTQREEVQELLVPLVSAAQVYGLYHASGM
jgi:26S proteasome regulatory subunit N1